MASAKIVGIAKYQPGHTPKIPLTDVEVTKAKATEKLTKLSVSGAFTYGFIQAARRGGDPPRVCGGRFV
jgi:hypothetical protein